MVHFFITSGPYAGWSYDATFSADTFVISNGASGFGTYTFVGTGANSALLSMAYGGEIAGDSDVFLTTLSSATAGTFTGRSISSGMSDSATGTFAIVTP
jgi:hypothetical protein